MDNDPALERCPFCGGSEIKYFHHTSGGLTESWHIECCAETCGNGTCHHETLSEAVAAWNTRAAPDLPANTVEAASRAAYAAYCANDPIDPQKQPDWGRGGYKTEVSVWNAVATAALTASGHAQLVERVRVLKEALRNPPKHKYWGAGEPDCPRDIKCGNGELHTLRCKVCGNENARSTICLSALGIDHD